jgi:hypothetical protein
MRIKSFDELCTMFEKDTVVEIAERQLTLKTAIGAPLVISWPNVLGAVQVMQLSSLVVPRARQVEVTLLLAQLNAALIMPGFTIDLDTGRILFRAPILVDTEGAITLFALQGVVKTCNETMAEHLGQLESFVAQQVGVSSVRA